MNDRVFSVVDHGETVLLEEAKIAGITKRGVLDAGRSGKHLCPAVADR